MYYFIELFVKQHVNYDSMCTKITRNVLVH